MAWNVGLIALSDGLTVCSSERGELKMKKTITTAAIVCAFAATSVASAAELTTNGGFEAGDTSGWTYFPTAGSTFNVTNDADGSVFAAELFNPTVASGAVAKQANIGIGQVSPGDLIDITFSAKGSAALGGVAFAEFFSEIDGGGVSSSEILGGGPLPLTDQYQQFSFQVVAGPDVSGGITLQFGAITGADAGSVSVLFIDNVSVVPTPGAAAILGLGGLAAVRRRR
jgi:MYXO-CTERM domain-containing protein